MRNDGAGNRSPDPSDSGSSTTSVASVPSRPIRAWWLAPDYCGRGLATEVATALLDYEFRTFCFPRFISVAQPGDVASIPVMETLGMHFDRKFVHNGIEVVSYAIDNPHA